MSATEIGTGGLCGEVQERLLDVLEGVAPASLYEHIGECDACRDLRYETEQAAELVAAAGSDARMAPDFAEQMRARVLKATETAGPPRVEAPSSGSAPKAAESAPIVVNAGLTSAALEHTTSPTVLAPTGRAKSDAETQPSAVPRPEAASPTAPGLEARAPEAVSATVPGLESDYAARAIEPLKTPEAPRDFEKSSTEAAKTSPEPASKASLHVAPAPVRPLVHPALTGKPKEASSPRFGRNRVLALGAGAIAIAAGTAVLWRAKSDPDSGPSSAITQGPWAGKVTSVSRASQDKGGGLETCSASGACSALAAGGEVQAGWTLRTDARTRAFVTLEDGTELALDRATRVALSKGENRTASIEEGTVVADVAEAAKGSGVGNARFLLPQGEVDVLGTKLALTAGRDRAAVEVARGSVRVRGRSGRDVEVRAGEEATLDQGGEPVVASTSSLADTMEWSDRTPEEVDAPVLRGLGELRAKKPGQTNERDRAVRLAKHSVKVRIVDVVARTEVDETFANDTDEELEGIFRFPLPPGAQIERLALEVDGKMMEGAFVDRDRGAAIWRGVIQNAAPKAPKPKEEILWVPGPWRDPALLEWQRGGRFELRIFPIPKRGSRRVVLTYTETVEQAGGLRRFTYPLAHDPSGTTKVDAFDIDLQVLGLDKAAGITSRGYELKTTSGEGERRVMHQDGFVPAGDLTVEYALPDRTKEVTAWAYRMERAETASSTEEGSSAKKAKATGEKPKTAEEKTASTAAAAAAAILGDASPYVAIAVRPKLPRWQEARERTFAIVVDASRSMIGERFARATRLASSLVREMDRRDSFVLLACDTVCRPMTGDSAEVPGSRRAGSTATPSQPGAAAAASVERFLGSIEPDGGSDLAATVSAARAAAGSSISETAPLRSAPPSPDTSRPPSEALSRPVTPPCSPSR